MEIKDTLKELIKTYNLIALDFDRTRYRSWTSTEYFLDMVKSDSLVLEIGCGNGKNIVYRPELINNIIAFDMCENFILICKKNKGLHNVFIANMQVIPFRSNMFDYAYSIAVLHHLDTKLKRIGALNEMLRILKPGGLLFINVWAFEQEIDAKRKFTTTDELVSWKYRPDGKLYYRYYHLYKEDELLDEIYNIKYICEIERYLYEKGNWGIILKKI